MILLEVWGQSKCALGSVHHGSESQGRQGQFRRGWLHIFFSVMSSLHAMHPQNFVEAIFMHHVHTPKHANAREKRTPLMTDKTRGLNI